MHPQRLQVLREVERLGTFAAAADHLNFTPSAVSQQMAKLESEAGVRLYRRTGSGIELTGAGRALARHSEFILGEIAAARRAMRQYAAAERGSLRIAAMPTASSTLVAHAVTELRHGHPDLDVAVMALDIDDALEAVRRRAADLAIVARVPGQPLGTGPDGSSVHEASTFTVLPLFDDPFMVAVSLEHPLARHGTVSITDLDGATFIGGPGWPGIGSIAAACEEQGVELSFAQLASNDFHLAQALADAGHGLALVPAMATGAGYRNLAFRPLVGAPRRSILAVTLEEEREPPVAAMLAILVRLTAGLSDGWLSADPPGRHVPSET